MGRTWWLIFNAFAVGLVCAAPRELTTDELITEPRPGEEYVNIQTSKDKVDLLGQSFTTSHRIPELSKTNRSEDFQTSHKIPSERTGRSIKTIEKNESYESTESDPQPDDVHVEISEGTTNQPSLERVVTRTSIKMSKSKKVQKSIVKAAHDGILEIKGDEGLIDESPYVDEEEQKLMKKKFSKSENVESNPEELVPPTRFNVPFEDDTKIITFENAHVLIPNPVLATTQEPPITTFNYKNIYDKTKKDKNYITIVSEGGEKSQGKYKYQTIVSESIKTAESKSITSKKDTKQDKKENHKREDSEEKEGSGYYVLPVNKQKYKEDNYDFVDVEEKVLVPAGSSPSQSSRINIKKGPNGQDYEYEYVYYYYDDDDEGVNGASPPKEGKVVASTTEKVYNGHDGPAKVDQEQNLVQSTSTSGSKYLPTEASKPLMKSRKKVQTEVVEEVVEEEVPVQNFKNSRGNGNGNGRFSPSNNRQPEPVNNEVLPAGRTQARSRGRTPSTAAAPAEEIPPIGEERLPANTRFPPRARINNAAPATASPPQEVTTKTRGREGSNQSRLRIPNLGLLDSSSFRTHASDASVEEDAIHDAELQRKAAAKSQSQTTETASHRRGTRPTTAIGADIPEAIPAVTRRPAIRRPVEERTSIPVEEEEEVKPRRTNVPLEEDVGEIERRPKVPLEEELRRPQVPLEDQEVRRPQVPLEDEVTVEQRQKEITGEAPVQEERRPQTTRESDAEEGVFDNIGKTGVSDQTKISEGRPVDVTTENQAAVGLTSAMMEKVALDLYAILQQAQNENIRTNFIDGNSTEVTTALGEGQTEFSTYDELPTAEPSTSTTTTTTTTTPAPTTITTTTTTPAPTQAFGRGRYRGRANNVGPGKGRTKVSTTTSTEASEEVTSPKTRGRFQPNQGTRGSGLSFARKPIKQAAKEPAPEEATGVEDSQRNAAEKTFGDRPRNKFRASGKVTTSAPAPTAAAPSAPASSGVGARANSADRFHSRRRGNRPGLPTTQHAAAEAPVQEDGSEAHQEAAAQAEEPIPSASPLRPTRPRIGGSVRPLRPGPRAPAILPHRNQAAAAVSSTQAPIEHEELEKEIIETEIHVQQPHDETQEGPAPAGDALTRLKSRPRLRIGGVANQQRPQTPPPPPTNRRKLVSSLLPKRKPTEEKPIEKVEEVEERLPEEIPVEEETVAVEPSSTTAEPETKGLSGLLAGRRRNLNRRPGTIYSRAQPEA